MGDADKAAEEATEAGDAQNAAGRGGADDEEEEDEALRALASLSSRARHRRFLPEPVEATFESDVAEGRERGEQATTEGQRSPLRLGPHHHHQGSGSCPERPIELE